MRKHTTEKSQLVQRITQQAETIHQLSHHIQLLQSLQEARAADDADAPVPEYEGKFGGKFPIFYKDAPKEKFGVSTSGNRFVPDPWPVSDRLNTPSAYMSASGIRSRTSQEQTEQQLPSPLKHTSSKLHHSMPPPSTAAVAGTPTGYSEAKHRSEREPSSLEPSGEGRRADVEKSSHSRVSDVVLDRTDSSVQASYKYQQQQQQPTSHLQWVGDPKEPPPLATPYHPTDSSKAWRRHPYSDDKTAHVGIERSLMSQDVNCDTEPQWKKKDGSERINPLYDEQRDDYSHMSASVYSQSYVAARAPRKEKDFNVDWTGHEVSMVGSVGSPAVSGRSHRNIDDTKRRIRESQDMLNQLQQSMRSQGV